MRARSVSEEMKVAAARALAELARRDVPKVVQQAYGEQFSFGPDYIIPKPFDPRVLHWVAPAVAKAAVDSGVAPGPYDDAAYRRRLHDLVGDSGATMRKFMRRASADPRKIVFPEGDDPRILRACAILIDENIARPIVLGDPEEIRHVIEEHDIEISLDDLEIILPKSDPSYAAYVERYWQSRQRKGVGRRDAEVYLQRRNPFGMMMVDEGRADGLVSGIAHYYADTIRPALRIIGLAPGARRTAGMYLILHRQRGLLFFGDTTVNIDTDAEVLADVAELVADAAKTYDVTPHVAMLSMSSFGSVEHSEVHKVQRAVEILRTRRPDLEVEGELHANEAVNFELQKQAYPFSRLSAAANVLVFPNLDAGNIAYKLLRELAGMTAIGPVLLGMARPVTALERDCSVDTIVLMAALTVVQAQERERRLAAAQ
jgi:malate dehydrogenase (oxaloacetate-decarboxylating)(NADP+)